jgi:hypothetical protein
MLADAVGMLADESDSTPPAVASSYRGERATFGRAEVPVAPADGALGL